MSGILWIIIVGFVAGIIARMISPGPNNPSGFILTVVLGIVGALVGGFIFDALGGAPITGFNLYSLVVAVIGAVVVLVLYHAVAGRRRL